MPDNYKKVISDAGRREKSAVFDKESAKWPWPELLKNRAVSAGVGRDGFSSWFKNGRELRQAGVAIRQAIVADYAAIGRILKIALPSLSKPELSQASGAKLNLVVAIPDKTELLIDFRNGIFRRWGNIFFLIGSNCNIAIIDRHESGSKYCAGSVYLSSRASSRVEYMSIAAESAYGFNLRSLPGRGSRHLVHAVGKMSDRYYHYNIESFLAAENSENQTKASFSFAGDSSSIIKLLNRHDAAGTAGDIKFRGIGYDASRAKADGMIEIGPKAARTDSYLKEDIILASDNCSVKAEPNLEIKNDNVKASHGATMGFMDKNTIFYLMSRGLPERQAQNLIAGGFLAGLAKDIGNSQLRDAAINYWN